jgi:hypothetical protein
LRLFHPQHGSGCSNLKQQEAVGEGFRPAGSVEGQAASKRSNARVTADRRFTPAGFSSAFESVIKSARFPVFSKKACPTL